MGRSPSWTARSSTPRFFVGVIGPRFPGMVREREGVLERGIIRPCGGESCMRRIALVVLLVLPLAVFAQGTVTDPREVGIGKVYSDPAVATARGDAKLLVVAFS